MIDAVRSALAARGIGSEIHYPEPLLLAAVRFHYAP